jgi:hypothetical protein
MPKMGRDYLMNFSGTCAYHEFCIGSSNYLRLKLRMINASGKVILDRPVAEDF